MSLTAKEAYKIALEEISEIIYCICSCIELSDRFLFQLSVPDAFAKAPKPLKVIKETGKVGFHNETVESIINVTCREKGKVIPLEELK